MLSEAVATLPLCCLPYTFSIFLRERLEVEKRKLFLTILNKSTNNPFFKISSISSCLV